MNKVKNIILTAIFALLLVSCEEVINLDLNNVAPQVVIEAVVTDGARPQTVKITKTGNFFESNVFPSASGALVTISDDKGNSEILSETTSGIYQSATLKGTIGNTYTLNVKLDGKEYTSSTMMQSPILIDSMKPKFSNLTGPGAGKDPGYNLHVYFNDRPKIKDYCLLKVFVNSKKLESYFLYDGKLSSGEVIDFNRFRQRFKKNDSVRIELLTLEFPVFEYFSTLSDILGSEGMRGIVSTGTPANPNTNLSNGALGYFAAYSIIADSVIIK